MQSLRLEELTWPNVKAAMESGFDTIVFAVGSTEQHGTRLPLASDTLMGEWLAEATARRLMRDTGRTGFANRLFPASPRIPRHDQH